MVEYISTSDQFADVFIKSLPSPQFHFLVHKLMGVPPSRLKGDIKAEGAEQKEKQHKQQKRHVVSYKFCKTTCSLVYIISD